MWGSCCTPRIPTPWAMTPCTSLGTTISLNGHHFFGTTFHPHSVCWVPLLLTALGSQRWFLYPPEKTPEFHPNKTTLAWLQDTYPTLTPSTRPLECTVQAGEVSGWQEGVSLSRTEDPPLIPVPHPIQVLYFPDRWWHATFNLDTSVFISTFLS
ncbi:jumonji domain containing 8 [Phyllostomus discolor]|uniref:Jumonji domain containing 8 n=1 Tax=Phyllostomus discolor TaxID=89673 RepID=A0A834BBF6_9CHIR|nr:jumonji domain containing 8 [Phyllostomus discolor]